jgi:hypothetical protein
MVGQPRYRRLEQLSGKSVFGYDICPARLPILLFPYWHIEYSLRNQAAFCPTSCSPQRVTVLFLLLRRWRANDRQAFFLSGVKASVLRTFPPSWIT